MAIDNLNYMSSWLPAWQLTDKYSSQPWCLKSKNLDIFSSSKSVKATAWSEATTWDADVIKQDWKLLLKTDWKVYERENGTDTLLVDPSVNFPVYKVSYNWENWTYADAQRWTAQDLVAKYDGDELKSFVVFTDRASYTWSAVKYTANKSFQSIDSRFTQQSDSPYNYWYVFKKNTSSWSSWQIMIRVDSAMANVPIRIYAAQNNSSNTDITLDSVVVRRHQYYYDAQMDGMVTDSTWQDQTITFSWDIKDSGWVLLNIPVWPTYSNWRTITLTFKFTQHEWVSDYAWSGEFYIDMNWWPDESWEMRWDQADWDYNEYYSYLPVRNRSLTPVGEYYWMKGTSFQPLYTWAWTWVDVNWEKKVRYDFTAYAWWESNVSMDIVWMIAWNEQVYMIGNMDWNWYIIPCDLSWWKGTPYIAYWCTFTGVENIDYLLYLVWEDRGISTLWVFNQQELVPVIWGNKENLDTDLVGVDEQYKFDW